MTTRVVSENEIFLNDTFFPIVGKVRSSIASNYPEKRITGDFNKDSQRRVSVQTWDDQRGGMGIDRMDINLDQDRCTQTGFDIRHKGHLTAGPLQATLTAGTVGIPLISELNDFLVVAHGTDVQDISSGTWTSRHTLAAVPTDVMNGTLSGTEFLIFCYTSGYAYSSAIATWATSTKNTLNLVFSNERFWGIDEAGQLWYTFTMGSAEVDDALLPLTTNEVVTGLIVGRDSSSAFIIYAVTSKGLYAHDIGNRKFVKVTGIILPRNNTATHERPAMVWRERIYLAAGRGIIEYDPVLKTIRDIGFDQDDGMPVTKDGFIQCLVASTRELFAGTTPVGSGVDIPVVMGWDGLGWYKVKDFVANTVIESMHVAEQLSGGLGEDNLYFANDARVLTSRLNNSNNLPANLNLWSFGGHDQTFRHVYPIFDAGQADIVKIALTLKVEVSGATSTTGLIVFVDFDGAGLTQLDQTFTNDSSFDATDDRIEGNGTTTFSFPSIAAPAGTEFRFIQIALQGDRDSGFASVDTLSVSLEYLKVLDEKLAFDFELDFNQEHYGQSPEQLRASYAKARALKTLPEFTFRDDTGGTRNQYVKVFADQGEEMSGHEERGTELVHCEQI